ncbi:hypothetical protein OROHE_007708 [Orobanche hederae]
MYNKNWHSSIKMTSFEALDDTSDLIGTKSSLLVETKEKISLGLLAAQYREKSYTDVRRRPLKFEAENIALLKVSPRHGISAFERMGNRVHGLLDRLRFLGVSGIRRIDWL